MGVDGVGKGHTWNQLSHRTSPGERLSKVVGKASRVFHLLRSVLCKEVCAREQTDLPKKIYNSKTRGRFPRQEDGSSLSSPPFRACPKRCDSRKRAARTQPLTKWPPLMCLTSPFFFFFLKKRTFFSSLFFFYPSDNLTGRCTRSPQHTTHKVGESFC